MIEDKQLFFTFSWSKVEGIWWMGNDDMMTKG